jgi:hypothetical protein
VEETHVVEEIREVDEVALSTEEIPVGGMMLQ